MEVSRCKVNVLSREPENFYSLKRISITVNLLDMAYFVEELVVV